MASTSILYSDAENPGGSNCSQHLQSPAPEVTRAERIAMNAESLEYVVVSTADLGAVWDFCIPETAARVIERAERRAREDLELYQNYAVQYPQNREYWEKQAERCAAKIGTYVMMTFDEFQAAQRAYYLGMPLHEITEDLFYEMLNVLPPLYWGRRDGAEMFCMSEFENGRFTNQYAHDLHSGRYYSKLVDAGDPSTWINEILKAERS